MPIGRRCNSYSKFQGRANFYALALEGPESHVHGAHVALEQCGLGTDIMPFQKIKGELIFML